MSEINDFKDLKIWQKGMDIAEKCYFLTRLFPKDELWERVGLCSEKEVEMIIALLKEESRMIINLIKKLEN